MSKPELLINITFKDNIDVLAFRSQAVAFVADIMKHDHMKYAFVQLNDIEFNGKSVSTDLKFECEYTDEKKVDE